jgi:hypothetical protein
MKDFVMTSANGLSMEPELRTMLGRHREELLRRALVLAVRRASLEELVDRPLGERLDELELLFEAAAPERPGDARRVHGHDLQDELKERLASGESGRVFSVAVVTAGRARVARLGAGSDDRRSSGPDSRGWAHALRECAAPEDVVIDAGDGATAVVFPDHDAREARVAIGRLCRSAWRVLGERGPLAAAGVAGFPEDGSSATEILAAAYDALWRVGDVEATAAIEKANADEEAGDGGPASVHPLRPL